MKRIGAMLDCSRNAVMKVNEVEKFASVLKSLGYNVLLLYTEDTYEIDGEPYFGYMRGRYAKKEMKEIVYYCKRIGMEVIPCIQTLAHLNQVFKWADYPQINDVADILLVGEDRTYTLIENMFRTLRECFRSEYIHIGMDEAHMLGLGKYLDKNGFKNRFEILRNHLKKVIELAEKYGFKPIMWSDMFFRLANCGEYYPENPEVSEDIIKLTPRQVGLVYWDYYHDDKNVYDKMFSSHKKFANEIWFAGGAWTWTGFAPGNKKTIETMLPAMKSARENGIDNVFVTMWGDNGKECSFYSVLPSLFAVKRFFDGETDMGRIKEEFKIITGEDFDTLCALDLPNYVGGNLDSVKNPCKYMLYSDPFNGYLDATVQDGVDKEYETYAERLDKLALDSRYSYLFESEAALCRLLSVKYTIGKRTRVAYRNGDKAELVEIVRDYEKAEIFLEKFYDSFKRLWYNENKPQGFEVQDLRLGGLARRLRSCRKQLVDYLNGKIDDIAELDEDILPFYAFCQETGKNEAIRLNSWTMAASVNLI